MIGPYPDCPNVSRIGGSMPVFSAHPSLRGCRKFSMQAALREA
jgi:hypothetical protein